jgi:hypothetical protein
MAVINRGFLLVDYAKKELYPGGGASTGKGGLSGLIDFAIEAAKPWLGSQMKKLTGQVKIE